MAMKAGSRMSSRLTIYTMAHCPTCDETRRTAAQIRKRFPALDVELIDLADPNATVPPEVFSAPTYMLDGDVISLGNPYLDQLEASILGRVLAS